MGEYIEREAALSAQNKSMNLAEMRERLKRIPAADVRPVVRATWKRYSKKENGVCTEWCQCSACGETATAGACYYDNETPYCPWCGAEMIKGAE